MLSILSILLLSLVATATILALETQTPSPCPRCGTGVQVPVLYHGVPGHLCVGERCAPPELSSRTAPECSLLSGPASVVVHHFGFDGRFFAYSGCYLNGLFQYRRACRGPQGTTRQR